MHVEDILTRGRVHRHIIAESRDHWDHRRRTVGARITADYAVELGYSREAVLVGSAVSSGDLDRSDTFITASQEIQITRNLLRLVGDRPGLGLELGQRFHLTTFGQFGFALLSSPRTLEMTQTAMRFIGLTFAYSSVSAAMAPDGTYVNTLTGRGVPDDVKRFLIERDLAATVTAHGELFANNHAAVPLLAVTSEFASGPSDVISGFSVSYEAPACTLVFEPEYLMQPLPQACADTAAECIDYCEQLLERRVQPDTVSSAVRTRLQALSGANDGVAEAARALHLTERTLRRRLAEEGTSYRRIVDQVRAETARQLVEVEQLTATEAALRVGFSDLPSFLKARRRWDTA